MVRSGPNTRRRCRPSYHRGMGFNPFRRQATNRLDVLLVAATIGVALLLVLWAILAG
jgi:hypothetical protein